LMSPTTALSTLSLHDALPICYPIGTVVTLTAAPAADSTFEGSWSGGGCTGTGPCTMTLTAATTVTAHFDALDPLTLTSLTADLRDRKSTRLNSSHDQISYAVF